MNQETCVAEVAHVGGFAWYPCGKPAKTVINGAPLCGIHKRSVERWHKATGNTDGLPYSVKPKRPA